MKIAKKIIITVLLLVFMVTSSDVPGLSNPVIAQAATVKITQKSLTLEVGQTKTLKVTGTTKKATWSSSKKEIATVSGKGKVTAVSAGKTTITATVTGKKFTCAVTVKEAANPYLKDAPFKAVEQKIGNISLVLPADWTLKSTAQTATGLTYMLTSNDTSIKSFVQIDIGMADAKAADYDTLKQQLGSLLTKDYFKSVWVAQLGDKIELKDFTQSDLEASFGKVFKTDLTISSDEASFNHTVYDAVIGSYLIQLQVFDFEDIDLKSVTEYVINSITIK